MSNKLSDEEQKEYENLIDSLMKGSLNGEPKSPDEQSMEILKLGIKFGERRNADNGGEKATVELRMGRQHLFIAGRCIVSEGDICRDEYFPDDEKWTASNLNILARIINTPAKEG